MNKFLKLLKIGLISMTLFGCQLTTNNTNNGWLVIEGVPTSTNAVEGQMCLDSLTYDIYQYTNGEWKLIGNIKGENGEKGDTGEKGDSGLKGEKGDSGETPTIEIIDGYWYINGENTNIKAEGDNSNPDVEKEKITNDEFRSFKATYGSFVSGMTESLWRARIEIGIKTQKGSIVSFKGDLNKYRWAVVETFDLSNHSSGSFIDSGWNRTWSDSNASYISSLDGGYLVLTVGMMDLSTNKESKFEQSDLDSLHDLFEIDAYKGVKGTDDLQNTEGNGSINEDTIKSVNHRGACWEAPENTLSAYRKSYENGFKYVETDVLFTKDNIPVLLHDDTIDRTSDGTGKISELTYEQASKFDYSYDSSNSELENKFVEYRGEKLPKFEEFIILCKRLNLHPYIELKGTLSFAQAKMLLDITKKCGMLDNVTWISFSSNSLYNIVSNYSGSRVGWVLNTLVDQSKIDIVNTLLRTGKNEVFFDAWYTHATDEVVDLCVKNNIPLEVWCCDTVESILSLNPYVSGVSSNWLNAEKVFIENTL